MTPNAAAELNDMIAALRQRSNEAKRRVSEAPDRLLQAVTGIGDVATCRRLASSPRVARRLDFMLAQAEFEQAQAARPMKSDSGNEEPQFQHDALASDAMTSGLPLIMGPLAPDFQTVMDRISAAIMLSALGAMLDRRQIEMVSDHFGEDAVAFGLAARAGVPEWMSAGAGQRIDIVRQFAATCLNELAHISVRDGLDDLMQQAAEFEPIPITSHQASERAAALAERAMDHAGSDMEDSFASVA